MPASTKRRLVLVGGADGKSAEQVIALVQVVQDARAAALRQQWSVSALPAASFEPADTQSLARWITFQAPDLIVDRRTRSAAGADAVRVARVKETRFRRCRS